MSAERKTQNAQRPTFEYHQYAFSSLRLTHGLFRRALEYFLTDAEYQSGPWRGLAYRTQVHPVPCLVVRLFMRDFPYRNVQWRKVWENDGWMLCSRDTVFDTMAHDMEQALDALRAKEES